MVVKKTGFLLESAYKTDENASKIILYFKTNKGKIQVFDPEFKPYFYIKTDNPEKKVEDINKGRIAELNVKNAIIVNKKLSPEKKEEPMIKLIFNSTKELRDARDIVSQLDFVKDKYEFDFSFSRRYLIDSGLIPLTEYEFEFDEETNELISKPKKISNKKPDLNFCAFDLETFAPGRFSDANQDPIITASFVSDNQEKVFSTKELGYENGVLVSNEKELIQKITNSVNEEDSDIVVTYNGDSFDFPYLAKRAKINNANIEMGFENSVPYERQFGFNTATYLKARQHLDAYQMLKVMSRFGAVNLIKFDLESVVEKIFGVKKEKITAEQMMDFWETEKELNRLADYNLLDSKYTLKIAQRFIPLFIEIGSLVRNSLEIVSRSSASALVESLLINKSFEENVLIPNKPADFEIKQRLMQSYEGGFVLEPKTGLHENIAVLDFSSLHPTIMISHNISPDTVDCEHEECKEKNSAPSGNHFCLKKKGFISSILKELYTRRMEIKKEMKLVDKESQEYSVLNARQHSLKIILNSFYGTLGYPRFRWYSRESAKAVTALSREYVQMVAKKADEKGFETIYGDSLTKERIIPLLNENNLIELKTIEELFNEISETPIEFNGKEIKTISKYKTLSLNPTTLKTEWQPINEIIRHKTKKKIYRVNQKFGETKVTEDHSLIIFDDNKKLKEIKPTELNNNKLIKIEKIPKTNNLTKIDSYEELKNYFFEPLYKDKIKISQIHKDNEFVWFGWTEQEKPIKIKRFIDVESKEFEALCRILGAYIAEDSSSTPETTKSKIGTSITSSNIAWLEGLKKDYNLLIKNANASIIASNPGIRKLTYSNKQEIQYNDKTHKLQLMNAVSAVLFKVLCGQKSHSKKLPTFIFNVPVKYKKMLLRKIIEGNGHITNNIRYDNNYKKQNFKLETKSLALTSGISFLLTQIKQKHTINHRKEKDTYIIQTCSRFNSTQYSKIKEETYDDFVYDLNVEKNNNFVDTCGQILLHNTDSAFIKIPKEKTNKDVENFVEEINKDLPDVMNLELEGFFKRGIFVAKKSGTGAAKKRYALIDFNNNLKIVGFEYVRRDWSPIARNTQKNVIQAVLEDGDPEKAAKIVKKTINDLKEGKVKKSDLTVLTQLKRDVSKYESIGPHVAAAKKGIDLGKDLKKGSIIGYIITRSGKSISDKAQLSEFVEEGNYDADYYLNNQVLPAVIRIMSELGYTEHDLIQGGKQQSLSSFM